MPHVDDRFSLFDQIPLGICVLRSDSVVLFWNRCLEDWTKINRDRIEGQSIVDFFPHFSQPRYVTRLALIFAGGPPTIFSSQLHPHLIPAALSDEKKRIQHTTVTAISGAEKREFYAMLSIQDVTDLTIRVQEYRQLRDHAVAEAEERKRAQERAEAANRVKDEFLAIVSHELRTPLSPILGWANLLCAGKVPGAAVQRALETIARNAALQVQLIDDLLDVSRILRGKLNLNWQTVNLVFVIHSVLDTLRLMAENKAVTVNFQHTVSPAVLGDSTRLQQVVWNLLTNAIKFTPEGGRIDIDLRGDEKYSVLSIQDTGVGIESDFLPYVFESFRQADGSTTRRIGGLGLGLAITRHLVELHGGTIGVQSAGVEQGSTFTVKLPNSQSQAEDVKLSISETQVERSQLEDIRILIVDDEQDTRDLLRFVLEECGAIVTSAESVAEAILALNDRTPDLILSDLGMPDADGFDFIRYVRTQSGDLGAVPVIALSAYASELTQQQSISAGFQQHLVKPIDPSLLIQAIVSILGDSSYQ